jgi:hypothetical protein
MMTRKHFKAMAEAFASIKPNVSADGLPVWRTAVQNMADLCKKDNPNFDRLRFLDACGYNGE